MRGERGAGKTSLVRRLQAQPFVPEYQPTPEIETATISWRYKGSDDVVKVRTGGEARPEAPRRSCARIPGFTARPRANCARKPPRAGRGLGRGGQGAQGGRRGPRAGRGAVRRRRRTGRRGGPARTRARGGWWPGRGVKLCACQGLAAARLPDRGGHLPDATLPAFAAAVSLDAETINVNRGAQAVIVVVDSRKARRAAAGPVRLGPAGVSSHARTAPPPRRTPWTTQSASSATCRTRRPF